MVYDMMGQEITAIVPKRELKRVKKITQEGLKHPTRTVWSLDFRGIRSYNAAATNSSLLPPAARHFASPEALQEALTAYFSSCEAPIYDKEGNARVDAQGRPITAQSKPYTIAGLALALGISTRTFQRFCEGELDADYIDATHQESYKELLVMARQQVEEYAETQLYNRSGQFGARFVLDSGFGWCTQREKADIKASQFDMWIKEQELSLKKEMASFGRDPESVEIRIVRKGT